MPELEPIQGIRIVATPAAVDGTRWQGDQAAILRIGPDEALGLWATNAGVDGDTDAIVEPEAGFAVARLDTDEREALATHSDWPIPSAAGSIAQGKIAGIPAKLLVGHPTLLVVHAAYADELKRRLGW